jgi:hypothetical protein
MRSAIGQIRHDDLTRLGTYGEMQLAPSPVSGGFLDMADVNPESCTIDEYVDRPIRRKPAKLNVTEPLRFFRPASYSGQFRTRY